MILGRRKPRSSQGQLYQKVPLPYGDRESPFTHPPTAQPSSDMDRQTRAFRRSHAMRRSVTPAGFAQQFYRANCGQAVARADCGQAVARADCGQAVARAAGPPAPKRPRVSPPRDPDQKWEVRQIIARVWRLREWWYFVLWEGYKGHTEEDWVPQSAFQSGMQPKDVPGVRRSACADGAGGAYVSARPPIRTPQPPMKIHRLGPQP